MRQAKFTKGLTVALKEEMYLKIRKITDQQGISMAEWVREMAEKALLNDMNLDRSSPCQHKLTS